jgi:hypothetical protein
MVAGDVAAGGCAGVAAAGVVAVVGAAAVGCVAAAVTAVLGGGATEAAPAAPALAGITPVTVAAIGGEVGSAAGEPDAASDPQPHVLAIMIIRPPNGRGSNAILFIVVLLAPRIELVFMCVNGRHVTISALRKIVASRGGYECPNRARSPQFQALCSTDA